MRKPRRNAKRNVNGFNKIAFGKKSRDVSKRRNAAGNKRDEADN